MCLEISRGYPVIEHAGVGPVHACLLVRVYLEKQLPVARILRQRVVLGIVRVCNAMRDELTLQAHIILNSVRKAEQAMLGNGPFALRRQCRKHGIILLLILVRPGQARYLQLWLLRYGQLAGKADGTRVKLTITWQSRGGGCTLQLAGVVCREEHAPTTAIGGTFPTCLLPGIIEKPEHSALWQHLLRIKWTCISKMNLCNE